MIKKAIVIGLGSMGKRRIRLIKQIDERIEILGIDTNIERCKDVEIAYNIRTTQNLQEINEADCAFICTSPLTHSALISECLNKGFHTFTELNLVDDLYEENTQLALEKNLTLFLSSTFLYRDEIEYLRKKVKSTSGKMKYVYHVGQYLPDWHPWENYKNFFVNDKRSNGCREIMAIEFPWLTSVFGNVVSFTVKSEKLSGLDIDYQDCYQIQLEHNSGTNGLFLVDIVSRKPVRNLEIFGENLYMSWDGSPDGLFNYDIENKEYNKINLYSKVDKQAGYSNFIIENAYKKEIECFFDSINKNSQLIYTFEKDKRILNLIDLIENEV